MVIASTPLFIAAQETVPPPTVTSPVGPPATTLRPADSANRKLAAPAILSNYRSRDVDTQLVVETITDTVLVTLIDNGTIDEDTISLIVNGKLAHASVGLNANLKYFWIGMVKGQRNQIIMYAENLGKMPPNTALMRVYHSGKTEWLYASSDYNKSFGLILDHRIINVPSDIISRQVETTKGVTAGASGLLD